MPKILKILNAIILILLLAAALLVAYARLVEPNRLITSVTHIASENAPEREGGVTVAVFADTHFGDHYTLKQFEKAVRAINSRSPDIVLFCGDLIDDYSNYSGSASDISEALLSIAAPMGKFAVYGNHDHGGGAHYAYSEIMENGGFQVLRNEHVEFGETGLTLIGLDDFLLGRGDANVVQGTAKPDRYNIVLCHEPDIADIILNCHVDLMVAGHTHGGQINIGQESLPGYRHVFFPPYGRNYAKGMYRFNDDPRTLLYVNSGLGSTMLPFRFMAPPEISFFALSRS